MTTLEKYNEIKTAYLSSLKTLSQSVAKRPVKRVKVS